MKAQLRKWGNSLAVRIPKPVIDAAKLNPGDHLEVSVKAPGVVQIRAVKAEPTLAQLLRAVIPENFPDEIAWGAPVGRELW
jgi:antitoxin MazE